MITQTMTESILVILAYLFGSISTAVIACRLLRLPDPRTQGSGNPGATNVLRLGGKKAAIIVLVGDIVKGVVPVLIARVITDDPLWLAATAFAAFIGHLYPVFFGFRGGKGVATAFGVLLPLYWPLALSTLATWLVVARLSKISSLGAISAAIMTPVYAWLITGEPAYIALCVVIAVLLLWRHRSNIRNLLNGTESRIGSKK